MGEEVRWEFRLLYGPEGGFTGDRPSDARSGSSRLFFFCLRLLCGRWGELGPGLGDWERVDLRWGEVTVRSRSPEGRVALFVFDAVFPIDFAVAFAVVRMGEVGVEDAWPRRRAPDSHKPSILCLATVARRWVWS